MPRRRRCPNDKHDWKPLRGGKFEKCSICRDIFPCRKSCEHADCAWVKGVEPSPATAAVMRMLNLDFAKEGLKRWKA